MGKRGRENARRMRKRPKPSPGSSGGGGGGGPAHTAAGLSASTTQVPAPGASPGGGGLAGTPVPPSRSSSSSSSGVGTQGQVPSTPSSASLGQARGTPPSAPSRVGSSSSSGGGGTPGTASPITAPSPFLTRRVKVPKTQSQFDLRYAEAEGLLKHLETHAKEAADDLWSTNKCHFKINFQEFRKQHRSLSHAICNNYQQAQELYTSALRTFLLEQFQTKPFQEKFKSLKELKTYVETHANLSFTSMPKSIRTFSSIPNKSTVVNIYAGERNRRQAIEAEPFARILLCKMLDHLLDHHKRDYCWDGKWSLDDWDVINENWVTLSADHMDRIGRDHSDNDLIQFATTVLPSFKLLGLLPSFMKHLQDELTNLPLKPEDDVIPNRLRLSEKDFFGWFYGYLKYHPALMSPVARSNLLQGFYFTMDKLDYRKLAFYNAVFNESCLVDWRIKFFPPVSTIQVPFDVFWHKRTPTRDLSLMPHENTFGGQLGFHRHLIQHTPDHGRTKRVLGKLVQSMTNSDESIAIATLENEEVLPYVIKKSFQHNMIARPEFFKHWKAYVSTYCVQI